MGCGDGCRNSGTLRPEEGGTSGGPQAGLQEPFLAEMNLEGFNGGGGIWETSCHEELEGFEVRTG